MVKGQGGAADLRCPRFPQCSLPQERVVGKVEVGARLEEGRNTQSGSQCNTPTRQLVNVTPFPSLPTPNELVGLIRFLISICSLNSLSFSSPFSLCLSLLLLLLGGRDWWKDVLRT